jgi:hypothetical protein
MQMTIGICTLPPVSFRINSGVKFSVPIELTYERLNLGLNRRPPAEPEDNGVSGPIFGIPEGWDANHE